MSAEVSNYINGTLHPSKQRAVAIAKIIWPNLEERSLIEVAGILRDVEETLADRPTPYLSRKEREAVKKEAQRLEEARLVTDKAWKAAERRVAKAFGGERVGPQGFNTADVTHPLCSVSVKYRRTLPRWAETCLAEARGFKGALGKLPLLVLLGRGMRISDGIVVMRVADFQELYGTIEQPASAGVAAEEGETP